MQQLFITAEFTDKEGSVQQLTTRAWTRTQLDVVVVNRNEWCAKLAGCTSRASTSSSRQATCTHLSDRLTNHPSTVIALIGDTQLLTGQFIVQTKSPLDYRELIRSMDCVKLTTDLIQRKTNWDSISTCMHLLISLDVQESKVWNMCNLIL